MALVKFLKLATLSLPSMLSMAWMARRALLNMSSFRSISCRTLLGVDLLDSVFVMGPIIESRTPNTSDGSFADNTVNRSWHLSLTSYSSPTPAAILSTTFAWSGKSSQHLPIIMPRQSYADFLCSRPSSILCLKGPRSIVLTRLSSGLVCSSSGGKQSPKRSLTNDSLV